jgi:hypothetical protein
MMEAFRAGLADGGFVEGANLFMMAIPGCCQI